MSMATNCKLGCCEVATNHNRSACTFPGIHLGLVQQVHLFVEGLLIELLEWDDVTYKVASSLTRMPQAWPACPTVKAADIHSCGADRLSLPDVDMQQAVKDVLSCR
jgi:hypothetical protein